MDLICSGILVLAVITGVFGWLARNSRVASAIPQTLRRNFPEEYARNHGLDFTERPFARGWSGAGMDFVERNRGWSYKFVADSAEELNQITQQFKNGLPEIVDNPPVTKKAVDELFDSVTPKGQLRS